MADALPDVLVRLLRERAQDPARRSGLGAMTAGSMPVEEALRGLRPDPAQDEEHRAAVEDYLSGMNSPFAGMISDLATGDGSQTQRLLAALGSLTGGKQLFAMSGDLGVVSMGASSASGPAPVPAGEPAVAAAEAELGFALPPALRDYYLDVADGGVGPGDGLYSLTELVAKHREMTEEPVGPQGQPWPAGLLPIQGEDWDLVSLDLETGRLVFWDLEELDDDEDLAPDQPTWAASFVPEADSLAAWLAEWTAKA
jgi:hypothetical protein